MNDHRRVLGLCDGLRSVEQSPVHTYMTADTYTVTLTAANSAGSNTYVRTGFIPVTAAVVTLPNQTGSPTPGQRQSV